MADGEYIVSIQKATKEKTIPQMAYYYAVILPTVLREMEQQGHDSITIVSDGEIVNLPLTSENIDLYILKPRCARVRDGQLITKTFMTIEEASMFIENCLLWAAESLGCVIPDANPEWFKKTGR